MKSLHLLLGLVLLVPEVARAADDKKLDDKKPNAKQDDSAVETVKDIAYYEGKDADPVRHKLDLYLPKGKKDFPVVMFVHGGTWKSGKKDLYAQLGEVFARNGVGMVIVNYRLSPAVQHPAHVQDVAKAFAWTFRNIAKYGGRPEQVFVCGHSAGGHLVALLATAQNYLEAEKLDLGKIKGVIALSGVYNISGDRLSQAFGTDPKVHEEASPLKHVKGGLPPFLIVYADNDFAGLDGLAQAMGKALKAKGDSVEVVKMDNRDHYTIIRSMLTETDPTTQATLKFIKKLTEKPTQK
ncbi:alpha/beta hydrolase [soil metagenome]